MSDRERVAAARAVIELLAERWPKCFVVFERARRPLKIGISRDIMTALDGAVTPAELGLALSIYCGNVRYLRALHRGLGQPRIDLNGEAAGVVSEHDAECAAARLAARSTRAARKFVSPAPAPAATAPAPTTPISKHGDGFAGLREAAWHRREQQEKASAEKAEALWIGSDL